MNFTPAEEKAVAVLYERSKSTAPKVVASGRGELARKMLQIASESGVTVVSDPDLVEILSQVPLGDEIPLELYQTVADLLAFIYQINQKYAQQHSEKL